VIHGGKAVHYPCPPELQFQPDLAALEARITKQTRAIVVINPNNPSGAVYSRETLTAIAELAERHHLVMFADEIYDEMLYDGAEYVPMAQLAKGTLCATFSGLSKIYRACGLRVGWVSFSGERAHAAEYLKGIELLASLRLCSNVPGQWAVQTALGGHQSVFDLTRPGGRLYESRKALLEATANSTMLRVTPPGGAMYGFVGVNTEHIPDFDDQTFAMHLLEQKHVLIAPGTSFNVTYKDHFRTTFLPESKQLAEVFARIEELLSELSKNGS
jgi:alanine-synthesizing transaminase